MPVLQTAMAVLAGGPYGPADIAGAMNRSLVMRSCRSDGVLLRPSWPVTSVDWTYRASFDDLEPKYIWAAYSEIRYIGGALQTTAGPASVASNTTVWYSYVLAINLGTELTVPVAELRPPVDNDASGSNRGCFAVVEGWHGVGRPGAVHLIDAANGSVTLPATPGINFYTAGHSFWLIAPVLAHGWVYLGEPEKIVKASHRRVKTLLTAFTTEFAATLLLAPAEEIKVAVLDPEGEVQFAACAAPPDAPSTRVYFGDVDIKMRLACSCSAYTSVAIASINARCTCRCTASPVR